MSSPNYKPLIIGVSARALFDMREESKIFIEQGEEAYRTYQRENWKVPLKPGTVFPLIKKLLALNRPDEQLRVEIVIITKNDAEAGHRVYESARHYGLAIPRAAMSKGEFNPDVLKAYNIDLFFSRNEENVVAAMKAGIAAAQVYDPAEGYVPKNEKEVHFAFDGDKVIFGGNSEEVFQAHGLDAYRHHEGVHAETPMEEGPFAQLLFRLNELKASYPKDECPIKISLVSMRSNIRPINTLHAWEQYVDALYFLGGQEEWGIKLTKAPLLKAISADIFFDDSRRHTDLAADVVPSGWVPIVEEHTVPSLSDIMSMAAKPQKKKAAKKKDDPRLPPTSLLPPGCNA